jgi:hypothetical protein
MAWAAANAVRAEHLGPCDRPGCHQVVRAGTECSECLEEDGVVVHGATCCPYPEAHQ